MPAELRPAARPPIGPKSSEARRGRNHCSLANAAIWSPLIRGLFVPSTSPARPRIAAAGANLIPGPLNPTANYDDCIVNYSGSILTAQLCVKGKCVKMIDCREKRSACSRWGSPRQRLTEMLGWQKAFPEAKAHRGQQAQVGQSS